MAAATSATACRPDEHCLFTVLTGTVSALNKNIDIVHWHYYCRTIKFKA